MIPPWLIGATPPPPGRRMTVKPPWRWPPRCPTGCSQAIRSHAVWMAKLARGNSWPGEMAHAVEDAAVRVIHEYGTDADRAAIEATS